MEARKKEFKKTVTAEDGRRRRGETVIQLRKAQKEEGLAKRRNLILSGFNQTNATNSDGASGVSSQETTNKSYSIRDIPVLQKQLLSQELSDQISALRAFRRLLSTEKNPPVQECIDCGALPLFVGFLQVRIIFLRFLLYLSVFDQFLI
jgi:importin subunit alpha-6/7